MGRDMSGAKNPSWKGGHRSWQQGKHGRDKENLSWKQQRKLAWVRDSLMCQKCGKNQVGRKPDCHHVIPYRIGFSHHLDNLICLCRSCHKRAEAEIQELWGGKVLAPPRRGNPRPVCRSCGSNRRKLTKGLCRECDIIYNRVPRVWEMRDQGFSWQAIGKRFGVSHVAVLHWLKKSPCYLDPW